LPDVAALSAVIVAHGDPADRIILATAHVHRIALVTEDAHLRRQADVPTIW
jgi:PIN domain nuclease of toxin-antitoxin system